MEIYLSSCRTGISKPHTQIFASAKDSEELTSNLNNDLNNINHWLISNKLQHHSSKTKYMYVASKHNLNKINLSLEAKEAQSICLFKDFVRSTNNLLD